jgi:hypothetical protein
LLLQVVAEVVLIMALVVVLVGFAQLLLQRVVAVH